MKKVARYIEVSKEYLNDLPRLSDVLNDVFNNGKILKSKEESDKESFENWLNNPKENIGDHYA